MYGDYNILVNSAEILQTVWVLKAMIDQEKESIYMLIDAPI